jgi:hypothetical protein
MAVKQTWNYNRSKPISGEEGWNATSRALSSSANFVLAMAMMNGGASVQMMNILGQLNGNNSTMAQAQSLNQQNNANSARRRLA